MDGPTIIIKQNRCFKEGIKEPTDYEEASGAIVNYKKSKVLLVWELEGEKKQTYGHNLDTQNVG